METIRNFTEKDIKKIIERHVVLYHKEYNFDKESFRSYVSDAITQFKEHYNPDKENIWIAEINNQFAGSIAIVREDEFTAQLRWFLVEPKFRGIGLGNKLINKVLDFCEQAKYKHIFLWTVGSLEAARHLYGKYKFEMTETIEHNIWGNHLVEERWDLKL